MESSLYICTPMKTSFINIYFCTPIMKKLIGLMLMLASLNTNASSITTTREKEEELLQSTHFLRISQVLTPW